MTRAVALLLSVLLLAGCRKKEPPRPPLQGEPVQEGTKDLYGSNPVGPGAPQPAPPAVYNGRTPPEWAERLGNRDLNVRVEAIQALGELKEEGYAHLKDNLHDESADVRILTLEAIPLPVLLQHEQEIVPTMIEMLRRDANPALREQAAVRLSWFDNRARAQTVAARLQALQAAAQSDPNPTVRDAAKSSMVCIQSAMRGKVSPD